MMNTQKYYGNTLQPLVPPLMMGIYHSYHTNLPLIVAAIYLVSFMAMYLIPATMYVNSKTKCALVSMMAINTIFRAILVIYACITVNVVSYAGLISIILMIADTAFYNLTALDVKNNTFYELE